MWQFLLVFFVLVFLIIILILSVVLGRWHGRRQLKRAPKHKLEVVTVAETSVFGLLALLIAFTFSGAYERFESRKVHILEEANAYESALNYVDVIPPQYQAPLRDNIRNYILLRIDAYHDFPYLKEVRQKLQESFKIQEQIWRLAIEVSQNNHNESLAQSFLQSIENMFETARMGMNLAKVHPPGIIFMLMIGLAALGGFLIGYDSAENKQKRPIHITCYILLTSLTIYIIFNLEFPRVGFIQYAYFDQMILDVRDHTNAAFEYIFPF